MTKIDLSGSWGFCLDREKSGIEKQLYNSVLEDIINLPTTVSEAKKGIPSDEANTGYLTDPYQYEGYTWYSKTIDFTGTEKKELFLVLERTRISHIWIDDQYVGSNNSLCSSHRYRLTSFVTKAEHRLTIMVDNTSYPTRGGHMTSPDTQTNWNGITGEIYIEVTNKVYLSGVQLYPEVAQKLVCVKAVLQGANECKAIIAVTDEQQTFDQLEVKLKKGDNQFTYTLGDNAMLWSEHSPKLYNLNINLYPETNDMQPESYNFSFGLRDFKAVGNYFEINGSRTFLRGKHDGLIFPMTGYAPTDVDSWLKVLGTAKEYGINHYRFHTCCPPEAAFTAADMLGIYMEPELPFWGTVTEEGEAGHDEAAQQYLISEGFKILDQYGNHPSFAMMSLGNELWGSKSRLNDILGRYKAHDSRHLYTQGSNNFQFVPCILEHEDFFCGVRFSRDRLFRGSYAMCDAPQGHLQTMAPNTNHNYDSLIRPMEVAGSDAAGGEVTIQYGTGTKTVKADASGELIPQIPVVSHEIGQYAMYPDYCEISKYTGVLKPRNLETFRTRLEDKGLLDQADKFFKASGRFSAECYKAELETALRSNQLAGYQILDLQDFTGQGTALVGILNAFMENKGVISEAEWRQFCSDTVLLAELPKLIFTAGEKIDVNIKLASFGKEAIVDPKLELNIFMKGERISFEGKKVEGEYHNGVFEMGSIAIHLPKSNKPVRLTLDLRIDHTDIMNQYDIWVYPNTDLNVQGQDIKITNNLIEAMSLLEQGNKVLYYPENLNESNSIEGTYCTDFWCYPMFRSISESMGRAVPIGTHGLLIDPSHKALEVFPTTSYSTPQWYDFVSNSRALILDETTIEPIVWTIDNFERNHRLGNIFEVKAGNGGKLLVSTCNLNSIPECLPAKWLEFSLLKYMSSNAFNPTYTMETEELKKLFMR